MEQQKEVSVIEVDDDPDPSLPKAIVLDLSPVNFLDTVGVKTLQSVRTYRSTVAVLRQKSRIVIICKFIPVPCHDCSNTLIDTSFIFIKYALVCSFDPKLTKILSVHPPVYFLAMQHSFQFTSISLF